MKSGKFRFRSRRTLILLALVCLMALIFEQSFRAAQWLPGNTHVLTATFLGILIGLLIAFTRFRASVAIAYHAILSVIFAANSIGRFFPSPALQQAASGGGTLWLMHVRIMATLDTLYGWLQRAWSSAGFLDQSWLLFGLTLIAWNVMAWAVWWIFHRKRALIGIIPLGAVLAINIHLSDQSSHALLLFVTLSILVTVSCEYWRGHLDWEARQVDHPDVAFEWTTTSVVLSFMITFLAFIFPLFASEQGWRSISDFMRRIQLEPQSSIAQDSQPGDRSTTRSELYVSTPDLSVIGSPIDQDTGTIMLVQVSVSPPRSEELGQPLLITQQHYWRSSVFTFYTGRGWQPLQIPESSIQSELSDQPPDGRYVLDQTFRILAAHGETLFAVNRPVISSEDVQVVPIGAQDSLLIGSTGTYAVTSWATDPSVEELTPSKLDYPQEILTAYLQLPDSLPPRVSTLAARITAGAETAYEKATKIETFLRAQYTYTLDVPPVPEGADAVDYFLFDAPGGFCSYYASAMAVMLRTQGVPARIVTGYAMGTYDEGEAAYRVLGLDSHAWVEVFFPEFGWVEFEPTAARSRFPRSAEAIQPPSTTPDGDTPPLIILNQQTLRGVVVTLILVATVGVLLFVFRRVDLSPKKPRQHAQLLYQSIRRSLRTAGYVSPPSTTPNEFLAQYSLVMTMAPKVLNALTQSTSLFLIARYSNMDIDTEEPRTIRRLWRRALPQLVRLWVQHTIQKFPNLPPS